MMSLSPRGHMRLAPSLLLAPLLMTACSDNASPSGGKDPTHEDPGQGHVTYLLDGRPWLIEAREGASPVDVGAALDTLADAPNSAEPSETGLDLSSDGDWLALRTTRFDAECEGWECLAVVRSDLSSGEVVRTGSGLVHPGDVAMASGGGLVVFGEDWRVWVTRRGEPTWEAPVELTADSPWAFHWRPALSPDGRRVLMDCGNETFPAEAICEVGVDGTGFRTVITREDGPGNSAGAGVHHADQAPDGSIVFEAEYAAGEQLWRLPAGGGAPTLIQPDHTNDNSPCVLPDGRVASLWLNRPGSAGDHELKLMAADGSSYVMLVIGADVADVGLGCGR